MEHPLFTSLCSEFSQVIQQRGLDYFRNGAVRLAETAPDRVLAFVQGNRRYTVEIRFKGPKASMSCTCPYYFDQGQPCKHLWALLLKLDSIDFFHQRERHVEPGAGTASPRPTQGAPASVAEWEKGLREIKAGLTPEGSHRGELWPAGREVFYVFDAPRTLSRGQAIIHLFYRDTDKPGRESRHRARELPLTDVTEVQDRHDREILAVLRGTVYTEDFDRSSYRYYRLGVPGRVLCRSYGLEMDLVKLLLPRMCETGRLYLKSRDEDPFSSPPIFPDEGAPWEFHLSLDQTRGGGKYRLQGLLRRADEVMSLSTPELLIKGGLLFFAGRLGRYEDFGSFSWINTLRRRQNIAVSREELSRLLREILSFPRLPPLEIAESTGIRTVRTEPRPRLKISRAEPERYSRSGGSLVAELSFGYGEQVAEGSEQTCGLYLEEEKLLVLRRGEEEKRAQERLLELGFRRVYDYRCRAWVLKLAAPRLPGVVGQLLAEGWQVEARGKLFRRAAGFDIRVTSGIDWFELRGALSFGDVEVPLPQLLKTLKKGESTVRLGDGSYGILPEDWLRHQGFALKLGQAREDHLLFTGSQAPIVDLLLQTQPQASADELFRDLREKLSRFAVIPALEPPAGFIGSLRGYQKQGLGWFRLLDELGFGGCLADDMGLGKTVQILALLESRRRNGRGPEGDAPSLVVVPRSLVFNWKEEARRFVPDLKILDHSGGGRDKDGRTFGLYDVVLTTYGTLRNDISWLKDVRFDYLILDEAQVVKNAVSITARAARLLQGRRRMALSGTPIENHLGELWSLFEFLNPGMLGGIAFFKRYFKSPGSLDESTRALLARFLRPFILRRTKEQVAAELPDKLEQTLFCELLPSERRRYNELQNYYRASLQNRIEDTGLGKAKIHVLEALLRLRQAACHPGLLDKKSSSHSGAKIDLLLEQLQDVFAEERKALVFSQFTSLLAIVRQRLDRLEIPYEYLDGRTRDRARRVERFQQEPECRLFLISLKAGGLGLNLTAAEYVFLLDPWWNPAVELQAIDRTHRIGQRRQIFAYRLIAKDTVEEKVLELQKTKRRLAESIISDHNRLIGELTQEDLAFLLS